MNGGRRGPAMALGAVCLALAALLLACGSEASNVPPRSITNGSVLYAQNCASCHGDRAAGNIAVALADPLYLQRVSDDDLRSVITFGRPANQMPAFGLQYGGPLTDSQITAVIGALRGFVPGAGTPAAGTPRLTGNGLLAGDAGRGGQVYAQSCARCHGQNGEGGSGGAIRNPNVLALQSDALLRHVIITGIPGGKMPDYAHLGGAPLTDQQISDLVALLASWRAGAQATPTAPANR